MTFKLSSIYVAVRMNGNLIWLFDRVWYMNYVVFIEYVMKRSQSEAKLTVCTNFIDYLGLSG